MKTLSSFSQHRSFMRKTQSLYLDPARLSTSLMESNTLKSIQQSSLPIVVHTGDTSNLPLLSTEIEPGVHSVCFDTEPQIKQILQQHALPHAEKNIYRKYRKFDCCTEIPRFLQVQVTASGGVFLKSDVDELWVYGRCTSGEFGLDCKEANIRVPIKINVLNSLPSVMHFHTNQNRVAVVSRKVLIPQIFDFD